MNKRKRIVRSNPTARIALVSLFAGILAGCSATSERFGDAPIYTGGTDNQRTILSKPAKQPSYQDIVNGPGGTTAGLPPASSRPVYTGSIPQQASSARPVPVQRAALPSSKPASASPQTTYKPRTPVETVAAPEVGPRDAVTWNGWTSAGGTRVRVRDGDTVHSISRRYGVPVKAIAAVNGIEYPGQVKAGQSLIIPTYVHSSSTRSASAASANSKPVRLPSAKSGQSLTTGSINSSRTVSARVPSPDKKPIRQPSYAQITSGQISDAAPVRISSSPKRKPVTTTGSIRQTASSSVSGGVPVPAAMPGRPEQAAAPRAAVIATPKTPTGEAKPTAPIKRPQIVASTEPASAASPRFRWPVTGRIISEFGSKPGGARNDGVNLAVPEGTPVKAAGAGTVIYAGNELKGFGNLVLLRHADGWVSAYAHNSQLNVKRGDAVNRGEIIANAGATGSVSQPQVHFELRKGNKPVDPLRYLPKS
jgi:murein DD-endopeptidase MepM/ murein hydrolase activator NlpD